jgi:hypothetical protein
VGRICLFSITVNQERIAAARENGAPSHFKEGNQANAAFWLENLYPGNFIHTFTGGLWT